MCLTGQQAIHQELEVYRVVFSGGKLDQLRKNLIDHQVLANREGFMVMYFNVGGNDMFVREGRSLMRRLNDLFDWYQHGVVVPTPVETEWDRFQLTTGKLMVDGVGIAEMKKDMEEKEKEKENQQILAEKSNQKDTELAAKDKQIGSLKTALQAFID